MYSVDYRYLRPKKAAALQKWYDEDFIKLIVATNSALFSIDGFDTILRHLSEGFMPLAFDVVGGAEITFEELLDTNRTDT